MGDRGTPLEFIVGTDDGPTPCRHCVGQIVYENAVDGGYWYHLATSSVWCDPFEAPDTTRAEPVPLRADIDATLAEMDWPGLDEHLGGDAPM